MNKKQTQKAIKNNEQKETSHRTAEKILSEINDYCGFDIDHMDKLLVELVEARFAKLKNGDALCQQ